MEIITRANDASVFMNHLLKQIGLPPKCTHIQFVEAFSKLQADSRKYEEELKNLYLQNIGKVEAQQKEETLS